MMRAFRFHLDRCTGCEACVVACVNENRLAPDVRWRQVLTFNGRRHPSLPVFHLSLACHHCAQPACRDCCPAGVYQQDPATGAITAHSDRCLGCKYCSWACPHDAPRFHATEGIMRKCTFCVERLESGGDPACVAVCPVDALTLGERPDGEDGFLSAGSRSAPQQTAPPAPPLAEAIDLARRDLPAPIITLRSEWPLLIFTTVATLLVALRAAAPLRSAWFLAAGLLAMAVSAVHLGRKSRAWRVVCNWRHSWLSREILLFSTFLVIGAVPSSNRAIDAAALATGFAALYAVDRLYQVALHTGRWNFHSAHTLLNALYLVGLLSGIWPLALPVGILKLALYAQRKYRCVESGRPIHLLAGAGRLLFGFALPLLFWFGWPAAVAAVLGDLLDRIEFYRELEVVTPHVRLHRDFERALGPRPKY